MSTRALNGATVRELREALGVSQTDLAARCEITQGHLSHVERGIYHASPELARRVADSLGVPLESVTYPVAAAAEPVQS